MENEQNAEHQRQHKSKNGTHTGMPAEISDAWGGMTTSMSELYRATDAFATEQARERPYVFLGVAAGLGFIIGGGLASRLGVTILGIGSRLAASRLMEELKTAK